ncbi:MAG: hypothetical protein HQM08_06735 [Candidatus Riflebacteria bacterium]|nr:hypothetical protein [Candidatus Riflebacteria bacterium]
MNKFLSIFLAIVFILSTGLVEAKAKAKAKGKTKKTAPKAADSEEGAKEPLPDEGAASGAGATAKAVPGAENILNEFERTISFDAHPLKVQPLPRPIIVNGVKVDYEIEFLEKWDSKGKTPQIKEIGFNIVVNENSKPLSINVPSKVLVKKSLEKGSYLGGAKFGDFAVQLFLNDFEATGKTITSVTVAGKLTSLKPNASVVKPVEGEANSPTGTAGSEGSSGDSGAGIMIAESFLKTAETLASNKVAQIAILNKALLALGDNPTGKALEMATSIKGKITALGGVPKASGISAPESEPKASKEAVSGDKKSEVAPATTPEGVSPAKSLLDEAKKQFAMDKQEDGRNLLRQAVEKDPKFWQAWKLMGENALANSKYTKAKEAFENVLQIKKDDLDSSVGYFKACYYLGDSEAGLERLREAVRIAPNSSRTKMALAEGYFQAGDYTACGEECQDIINKFNAPKDASDLLAKVHEKTK